MGRLVWKAIRFLLAAGTAALVLGGVVVGAAMLTPLPRPELPVATEVYDRDGRLITRLRGPDYQNRTTVSSNQLSDSLKQAVVAIEDERFYQHYGLDPVAIGRAAYRNLRARKIVEGGSTITQQLAKNLFTTRERTLQRKLKEALYTIELEAGLSKQEILTLYLNQIYLGHGVYGAEAAAALYFGKSAAELSLSQAALLAGIIRAPEYYSPYRDTERAKNRRNLVLDRMVELGYIDAAQAAEAKAAPVETSGLPTTSNPAPYFVDYVTDQLAARHPLLAQNMFTGGYKLYTTLDLEVQRAANRAVEGARQRLKSYASRDGRLPEIALVALDPTNGHVTAMIGGLDYAGDQNRAVSAARPAGSAFKPFLYTALLERGYTTIDTRVCEPVEYPMGEGRVYKPTDYGSIYDRPYHWRPLTVREAVAKSDNVVAVRWAHEIKPEAIVEVARRLGIRIDSTAAAEAGLSTALGTLDVTPLSLARAYAAFANTGYRVKPLSILRVVDPEGRVLEDNSPDVTRVLSEEVAYIMTDLLQSVFDPHLEGTASHLRSSVGAYQPAGKTGTTDEQRDVWFAGYTPSLVSTVWVGFDDYQTSLGPRATGGVVAGPIWVEFMNAALTGQEQQEIEVPRDIVWVDICRESGLLPAMYFSQRQLTEVFIRGTEPANPCPEFPWWGETPEEPGDTDGKDQREESVPVPAAPDRASDRAPSSEEEQAVPEEAPEQSPEQQSEPAPEESNSPDADPPASKTE